MMEARLPQCNVKMNGSNIPDDALMLECVVENSIHVPDMCTFRLQDAEFKWLDSSTFEEGTKVEVQFGYSNSLSNVFKGEVVGLELDLSAHGVPTMTVRCYDKSHRLHRGRKSRAWSDITDSDLASQIGAEAGLVVEAESTDLVYPWLMQRNQTNYEFLVERAKHCGYRLYMDHNETLKFAAVKATGDATVKLTWGVDLRSFRPRTSLSQQVSSVTVQGWDPKTKEAIIGKKSEAVNYPAVGRHEKGGTFAASAFTAGDTTLVGRPIYSQAEAEKLAQSVLDTIAGEYLTADGLCDGTTSLQPGCTIEISNIGSRFAGKYLVTSTTHVLSAAEGYSTQFSVSGKHPDNIVSMLEHKEDLKDTTGRNIVIGIVTDNKDPETMGRVKVKYPWMTSESSSYWARIATQMGGPSRGMYNLPEVGDEVLIGFELGDITRPYVLGMLWNGKDTLPDIGGDPVLGDGNEVNRRMFVTRIGHQMSYNDTDGLGDITFKTKAGHTIMYDDKNKRVQVKTTNGHEFTMDDANKKITAKTTGGHTFTMDDTGPKIDLKTTGGLQVTMDDASVSITAKDSAGNSVKIDGTAQSITLKANATINIEAQASVSIKAPQISVQGEGTVSIQAPMVSIN